MHYFRREGMFQKLSSERDSKAARAELRYSVTSTCREASLVKVTLETGLQNQIRVQLAAVGHPIVGDRKYAPAEASEKRIALASLFTRRVCNLFTRGREMKSRLTANFLPTFNLSSNRCVWRHGSADK